MNSVTEQLANLSPITVIVVIAVLVAVRFVLLQLKSNTAKSVAEIAESLAVAMGLVFLLIRPFFVQAFFIPSESMEPTLLGHDRPTKVHDHILVNKAVYRLRAPKRDEIIVFAAPPEALEMSSMAGSIAEGRNTDYIKRVIGVEGDVIYVEPGYLMVDGNRIDRMVLQQWIANQEGVLPQNLRLKLTSSGVILDGKKLSKDELLSYLNSNGVGSDSVKLEIHPGVVVRNGKRLNEPFTAEDPMSAYPDPADDYWPSVQKAVAKKKLELVHQDGHLAIKVGKGELFMMGDNRNHSSDSRFWGPLDRDRVLGRSMFIFWPFDRMHWSR